MERFLIESEVRQSADNTSFSRTDQCPAESWYWDFMDGNDTTESIQSHAVNCAFCCNELRQVGRAMLMVPDGNPNLDVAAVEVPEPFDSQIAKNELPLPKFNLKEFFSTYVPSFNGRRSDSLSAKVILRSVGGSILEIYNSLEAVPAYRAHAQGLLVLATPNYFKGFRLEISTLSSGKFSLVGQSDRDTWLKEFALEFSDESGILRSFSMQSGERRSLGDWGVGRYRLSITDKNNKSFIVELNLR